MHPRHRSAIALPDLLVLLGVVAIVFALLPPAVVKARAAADKEDAANNLKALGIAVHNYADTNNGKLPLGCDANNFSVTAHLLPYLEQEKTFKQIDFKKPVSDKANAEARKKRFEEFLSPRDPLKKVYDDAGATNYLANDLIFRRDNAIRFPAGIPDGTSNTIMWGETLKGDTSVKAVTALASSYPR